MRQVHSESCGCGACDPSGVVVTDGATGESRVVASRAFAPRTVSRLRLPSNERGWVESGAKTAHLTRETPSWRAGDRVPIEREWLFDDDVERRSEQFAVLIDSVASIQATAIDHKTAVRLGYKRGLHDWRRAWLGPTVHPARFDTLLTNEGSLWLTLWTAFPVDTTRFLPPAVGEHVSMTTPQMRTAGEAVPADYQETLAAGPRRAWDETRRSRVEATVRAYRAKKATAMRESTRRGRIDVARSSGSRVGLAAWASG